MASYCCCSAARLMRLRIALTLLRRLADGRCWRLAERLRLPLCLSLKSKEQKAGIKMEIGQGPGKSTF